MCVSTGNRKSGLSLSWKEPLPTPVYEIHHQSSIDSNPYVSLESPPASPHHSDSGHNVLTHRKKLFTFSRPPRSRDTDKFLDSLSEQLGHRVTLVDDFVPGENDYEEVRKKNRCYCFLRRDFQLFHRWAASCERQNYATSVLPLFGAGAEKVERSHCWALTPSPQWILNQTCLTIYGPNLKSEWLTIQPTAAYAEGASFCNVYILQV